jgi:hypothetical protein
MVFARLCGANRLLLVIPILILAESALVKKFEMIAQHFIDEKLVREDDRPRFESVLAKFNRMGNSLLAQAALLVLCV